MAKKYYSLLLILAVVYLTAVFATDPSPATIARYHTDAASVRLILVSIALPTVAIWCAAFYGLINVAKYAKKIENTPDGDGFGLLAKGVVVLGVGLPLNSAISNVLSYTVRNDHVPQATATIITTHLTLLFPLVGFLFLLLGSRQLVKIAKKKGGVPRIRDVIAGIVLAVISMFYIIVMLSNAARTVPPAPDLKATYYMPDWLIITTIAIPYIVIWGCGFLATLRLHAYQQNVGGKIYKKALRKLNIGFILVILTSIGMQFMTAMAANLVASWSLATIALLIYFLLLIIASGYIMIALGAKELKKIEEVT